jgi:hypothetical protein
LAVAVLRQRRSSFILLAFSELELIGNSGAQPSATYQEVTSRRSCGRAV